MATSKFTLVLSTATKVIAAIVATATMILQVPVVQTVVGGFLGAHFSLAALLAGISGIAALFHNPAGTPTAAVPPSPKIGG